MPYPRKSGLISPSATDAHRHEYSIGTVVSRLLKNTEWQNPCRAPHPLMCLRYWKHQCAQYLHTALGCLWLVAPTGNELTRERAASSSTSPGIRDSTPCSNRHATFQGTNPETIPATAKMRLSLLKFTATQRTSTHGKSSVPRIEIGLNLLVAAVTQHIPAKCSRCVFFSNLLVLVATNPTPEISQDNVEDWLLS